MYKLFSLVKVNCCSLPRFPPFQIPVTHNGKTFLSFVSLLYLLTNVSRKITKTTYTDHKF